MSLSTAADSYKGRALIAKPGLDGHDRGALVISRALLQAGFEVIYTGRRQTSAQIASAAIQESVDVIGLSILSGSHVELCRRLIEELAARGADDIPVVVGGTIRPEEVPELAALGVAATFPTGTPLADCVGGMEAVVSKAWAGDGASR